MAAGTPLRPLKLFPPPDRHIFFGDAVAVRELVRDNGWENTFATASTDLRLSVRLLGKSPVFTGVVLLAISLGCGAVTTIFSAMNALVLRPLPGVSKPGELLSLRAAARDGSVAEQASCQTYTYLRDHVAAGCPRGDAAGAVDRAAGR